jgi:hypothetical protein
VKRQEREKHKSNEKNRMEGCERGVKTCIKQIPPFSQKNQRVKGRQKSGGRKRNTKDNKDIILAGGGFLP